MSAPSKSSIADYGTSDSPIKGGFYLQSRTKIWVLAVCLALMIGASVYAVLQPLNPDPWDTSLSTRLWYPRETNPYARLQAVHCASDKSNDYACRLNSVAANGIGDLPEIWAVGNVGLVLHRPAGQNKWEQLTITARPENAAVVPPRPTPTPGPAGRPTPLLFVPNLMGLSLEEAQKKVGSYFKLETEYEKGSEPNPRSQQGPAPDLRVIGQLPAPNGSALLNSTIKITLGRPPKSAASLLLDSFMPKVYAAEPEQQQQPTPSDVGNGTPAPQAVHNSPLDDDLIHTFCFGTDGCWVYGRSGRIYRIAENTEWTFIPIIFSGLDVERIGNPTLLYMPDRAMIVAKSTKGELISCVGGMPSYKCSQSGTASGNLYVDDPPVMHFAQTAPESFDVGRSGLIKKNNGALTTTILSGTTADIHSMDFSGQNRAWIVGDHGIILSTSDGGNTWRHETQGPEGAVPNHRLPAIWYWVLAFLMILTCSVVVAAPPPPQPTEFSVADWTVTDAPLKPGDLDSLNFTPMALGLSRFIRNPKTQPPVTIAIEGEWGEGKSSVMSLLRGDLEKSRFRPVWFNAWHHQSEDQLLAALLEHIKSQAVPPWWHIDNWVFRARLLHLRFREKWPLMIVLVLALCSSVAFELARHGLKWEDFVKFGKDVFQLLKYLVPWSSQKELPDDLGHFGLVVTVLAMFAAIFRKAQAFGINPAKLTDNLRDAATIKDVKPDPGIRRQFAREFGDLCSAWCWGGRRVIIFIDDLDRCRPESVVTVLESINFLTTAGDCMIVLGMAQKQVTHCVGFSFKDIALAENAYKGGGDSEQAKAVARFNYGSLYIRKLVNIVAPLPKTTQEQRRRVLEVKAAAARRLDEEQRASAVAAWRTGLWEWLNQAGSLTFKVAPVFGLVLVVVLSVLIGYKQGIQQVPTAAVQSQVASHEKKPVEQLAPPGVNNIKGGNAAQPLIYARPTTQPATLADSDNVAAGVWWSFAVDGLFLIILFGTLAYQLSARSNQDAQNSPDFEQSLQLWGRYIVGVCDTPREIKRALNDLRYQAMTRRNNGPSNTRGERLLRALRQFVTGRPEMTPMETHVDEAALPPRKAAELANLSDEEWQYFLDPNKLDIQGPENLKLLIELKVQHLKQFKRWIAEEKPGDLQPAPEPVPEIGAENAVGRAAHQA